MTAAQSLQSHRFITRTTASHAVPTTKHTAHGTPQNGKIDPNMAISGRSEGKGHLSKPNLGALSALVKVLKVCEQVLHVKIGTPTLEKQSM